MANLYDLKKFDLNLLIIFECIYQNLSISKAAETLYITPSAVSQSLQRLRTQFNDPLFIRSGKGITPTVTGINLHHHLEENLNSLEQTINIMHSSSLKKKFIIYSPQLLTAMNVIKLINFIMEDSSVEIEHHDILMSAESAEDLLAYRKADMVITTTPLNNHSVVCTPFKTIKSVLVCRADHPRISDASTLAQILEEPFTSYQGEEPGVKEYQSLVNSLLASRKIGFRSDSMVAIINTIAETDIIGIVPEVIYDFFHSTLKLQRVNIDQDLPSVQLYLVYNRTSLNNKGFTSIINKMTENS
ncbi:LysR family transcriptional regulator [Citrobacter koseri]|uniref:DNA-binding transcriptional repressor CitR n=1 Tax=Citrobacter koseri TaxID=545 RepID=UPI0023B1F4E4|nr:LysR family transcriptional regulator [Citrobacter koseri]EKU0539483.1 LysR family transcriptional regulator [Citrobacter koseri]EKU8893764.1 LysR family transcriptional regulator [Citrobacter koseri]MDT7451827.1 LysR family transcriptional regulator [Citrobacter koseri]HEM6796727.1 LysR family transcriptional regulator [Citrobacter koseri]HEM6827833.1 LysR family transcriptional regulator [Citrobacter koseri]